MEAVAAVLVTICAVSPAVAAVVGNVLLALGMGTVVAGIIELATTIQNKYPTAADNERAAYMLALWGYLNQAQIKLGMIPTPIPTTTTPEQIQAVIRYAVADIAALAPTVTPTTTTTTTTPTADFSSMPTFATIADLNAWFSPIQAAYYAGSIDVVTYGNYLAWYDMESTRLASTAGAIPAATPPAASSTMTYPTFDTLTDLKAWYASITTNYQAGTLSATDYANATAWYNSQYNALLNAGAELITVTVGVPTAAENPSGELPINVAAPTVNVYPQIQVQSPPAAVSPISITNEVTPAAVYNQVDLSGMVSALPLIGTGIASAILAQAGAIQHEANLGRNTCFQSTGQAMLSNILQAVAPLALTLGLENFGPFRNALDGLFTAAWDKVLGDPSLAQPVTPDRAPSVSRALFVDALEAGMTAHLISAVAESVAPLKSLGLDYMAAFLGDMAGFAKIGGAMMGAIESQALTVPFRYYINNKVRSYIPMIRDLGSMAAEYELVDPAARAAGVASTDALDGLYNANRSEFLKWGAYSGYTDNWLEKWFELSFRPVSYFNMRSIATAGVYDEPFFIGALAHSGYSPEAIKMLLSMLKRMSVSSTVDMLKSESRYDYLDGFIDVDTYGADLTALGDPDNVVQANMNAAEERRNRTMAKAKIQYMLTAISKSRLSLDEFSTELTNMGIDPPMIDLYLQQAALKVKAESTTAAFYQTDTGKTQLDTIRRRRVRGEIDATTELNQLIGIELSQALAQAYVDNDTSRIRDTVEAYYQTDAGKVDVNTVRRSRIAGTISDSEETAQLRALDMSQELAAAIVANDTVRLAAKAPAAPIT